MKFKEYGPADYPAPKTSQGARRTMMYTKLHRVTVTDADLNYPGSITIDTALMRAAGLDLHSLVDVLNVTNGERLQTYVIEGPENSGTICLNGAAAHQFSAGDIAIVVGYEDIPVEAVADHEARVVQVDDENRITAVQIYSGDTRPHLKEAS